MGKPLALRVSVTRSGLYRLEKLALLGITNSGTPGAMPGYILGTSARFLAELCDAGSPLHGHPKAFEAQKHAQELRAFCATFLGSIKSELETIVAQELRPRELTERGV